jgi:hypothetical protein
MTPRVRLDQTSVAQPESVGASAAAAAAAAAAAQQQQQQQVAVKQQQQLRESAVGAARRTVTLMMMITARSLPARQQPGARAAAMLKVGTGAGNQQPLGTGG